MSEIKAGVTLMQDFCVSQSDEFQSYIDYMDREEAQRNQAFQTYSLFHDYMDNPEKSTGLFTDKIDRVDLKQKKELKELFQKAQENGSNMWQTVISFDNRWLEKNGIMDTKTNYIDEAQLRRVARYGINKMLLAEGLELAAWCASFHYNTDNIHIHVATVEPYPTRQVIEWNGRKEYKGKFKLKSLEQCKSCVVNEILHTREINQKLNHTIRKDIVEAKKRNRMIDDPEMRKGFLKLYEEVSKIPKGVRNYNNGAMVKLHPEIDKLSLRYMEKYHPKELEEFKEMVTRQSNLYAEAYGKYDTSYMEGKTQDLYTRLGNAILKEVKWYEERIHARVQKRERSEIRVEIEPEERIPGEGVPSQRYLNFAEEDLPMKTIELYKKGKRLLEQEYTEENRKKAWSYLKRAADRGNPYAALKVAQMHEKGEGCEYSKDEAWKYYERTILGFEEIEQRKRNAYAEYVLGKLKYEGKGCEKDKLKGKEWLERSDRNEGVYATYYLGRIHLEETEEFYHAETGMNYLHKAAEKKHAASMYRLGEEYFTGEHVKQDLEAAHRWYKEAADKGNPYAAYKVAKMYETGLACDQSTEKKEKYYEIAREEFIKNDKKNPDVYTEGIIGRIYYEGKHGEPNEREGIKWLEKADVNYKKELEAERLEKRGHTEKGKNRIHTGYILGKIYLDDTKEHYDPEKGKKHLIEAAVEDYTVAQYRLGAEYLSGAHIRQDDEKALYWFEESVKNGHIYGKLKCAEMYETGRGCEQSQEKATATYKSLIGDLEREEEKAEDAYREYVLGKLYCERKGEERTTEKGIGYLVKSAEKGNEAAQVKLGCEFLKGEHVPRNVEMAREYLMKAAEQGNDFSKGMLIQLSETGRAGSKRYAMADLDWALYKMQKSIEQEHVHTYKILRQYELEQDMNLDREFSL